MSIFTKLKTATDFSASVIKEGFALIWPEKKSDGSVALQVKLEDGSVQEIGGGSAGDIDAAVRIYDATIDSDTGVVTITDGTPVSDLHIGDEIRTPGGVYQKIKDNTTTTGPADGSRIEVSGITSPADANGYYTLQSENLWKHETANYWITLFSGRYWMISDKSAPASPGECIFFVTITGLEVVKPWEIDTSWEPMNESVGDPQVENVGALTTVANTIDLFEYAAFPKDGAKTSDITDDIATHNQNPSAHPDKLPLSGGQMTGGLKINATDALRINNGDYGVFLRKDASSFYIMVTAQGDPNGSYTDARPFKLDLATGVCSINGAATTDSLGNVITTTYAPLNHPIFSNGLEITGTTPYIDFHYNNSESDYTFRIVQDSEDTLTLGGKVAVSNTLTVTSGGMSVAGNIKNTGEIQSETTNSYRHVYGNYGTFWRNDGRGLYLMITNSGDQYGPYNDFRPISVNLSTGQCDISGTAIITENKLSDFKYELNTCGLYPRTVGKTDGGFDGRLEQGNYWYNNAIHVGNPIGDMSYCSGMLYVHNVNDVNRSQIFHCITDYGLYYRWYYGDTWRPWFKALTNDDVKHVVGATNTNVKQNDYIIIANTLIIYFGYTWVDRAGNVTVYLPVASSGTVSAVVTCTNPQTSAITNLKCYTQQSSIEIVIDSTTTTTQTMVNWIAIGYLA